ncbi:MAG: hypothetical protein RKR03_13315, partial [Candidatus Competibacter sp.]|nr:hypothetical protein [Candidatus Competibacter sp.]
MSAPSLFVPQRSIRTLAPLALIIGLVLLSAPAQAATLIVTNNNDSGAGSLRQAIADASAGDTITFDDKFSITLTSGELSVTKSLTIDGDLDDDGAPDITVSGNNTLQVFAIMGAVTVTLDGLTITGGWSPAGGGIYAFGGTLTVAHSTVSGNSAVGSGGGDGGGGIYAFDETLTVAHSTVSGNSAVGSG